MDILMQATLTGDFWGILASLGAYMLAVLVAGGAIAWLSAVVVGSDPFDVDDV